MTNLPRMLTNREVEALRGPKAAVDAYRPYACLVEPECAANGRVEDVATIFLTNRECPFRCVFCDLWRHTLDEPTPAGAVPMQIDWALAQLPPAPHIKLYNSGNFFDPQAIPVADYPAIAERVREFHTVIVENHPRLCGDRVWDFQQRLAARLEVALGLETVHPEILPRLNKQMTVADFEHASRELRRRDCDVRAFVILQLPGMTESEGIEWAVRSVATAFAAGAQCASIIPLRGGNGAMEELAHPGDVARPSLPALYETLCRSLELRGGRVFVDLWGVESVFSCKKCGVNQAAVLQEMNLLQTIRPWPRCDCAGGT